MRASKLRAFAAVAALLIGAAPAAGQFSGGIPGRSPSFRAGVFNYASAAVAYDSDAQSYFAAMTVQPDTARKSAINTFVGCLKSNSVWTAIDWLSIAAAHDAQAARINLITPTRIAAAVNSPTFTTDRGYQGDGSTSYLDSGLSQSGTTGNYVDNGGSIFAWVNADTNTATGNPVVGTIGASASYINPRTGSTQAGRVNSTLGMTNAASTRLGFSAVNRSTSTNIEMYRDGGSLGSLTSSTAAARVAGNWTALRSAATYSTSRVALWGWGGSMTATQHQALYSCASSLLSSYGAN